FRSGDLVVSVHYQRFQLITFEPFRLNLKCVGVGSQLREDEASVLVALSCSGFLATCTGDLNLSTRNGCALSVFHQARQRATRRLSGGENGKKQDRDTC